MPDTYKLQYDGMTLTYPGWNGYVSYEAAPAFKTLTLYHSEGGTLTANELTGYPGDTINLTTAYNTYWRFSGYQLTGDGTIANNTYTFGNEDATICACYKVNAFTATGGFEKGSDVEAVARHGTVQKTLQRFAIHGAHTGDVPTSWYSTSNRWKPSNASAYSITLHPVVKLSSCENQNYKDNKATIITKVDETTYDTQNYTMGGDGVKTYSYNKTRTVSTQGNYSFSAFLQGKNSSNYVKTGVRYVATGTTGTWTATGIAP